MKKTIIVAAVSGLFASAAHAQSSVTLYGLIDAGFAYANDVRQSASLDSDSKSLITARSGNINGSRWGLRGVEDLGAGLKGTFVLENGFDIMNGSLRQNGRMFGRQAYVGLGSEQAGTISLGRQYDSVVDFLGPLSLSGTEYGGTYAAHPFDNDNLNNSFRVNNSVKFTSANFGGFRFGGQYGFSNSSNFANNRAWSAGLGYEYMGFNLAGAYFQGSNVGTTSSDVANAFYNLNSSGAVAEGTTATGRQRIFGGGISYKINEGMLGFVYTQSRNDDGTGSAGSNSLGLPAYVLNSTRFTNYEVNGRINLTPAWNIAAQYTYTDGKINALSGEDFKPKFHTATLQTGYKLSKRTDAYVLGTFQKAKGDGSNAYINGVGVSNKANQFVIATGVRHKF